MNNPPTDQWTVVAADRFAKSLLAVAQRHNSTRAVIAIDGRSGAGKSTLAATLNRCLPNSCVLHTDDLAWNHSFFDWATMLVDDIVKPYCKFAHVKYRPAAWDAHQRDGEISIPETTNLLIVEGVGANRIEMNTLVSASVWVSADMAESKHRGIIRDGGTESAELFWNEWMAEEIPFLEHHQPWLRSTFIVNGTPEISKNPFDEVHVDLKTWRHSRLKKYNHDSG